MTALAFRLRHSWLAWAAARFHHDARAQAEIAERLALWAVIAIAAALLAMEAGATVAAWFAW